MEKKIKVYTTPMCPQCERAKDFLKTKSVKFETIDISKDEKKAKEIFEKTGKKIVPIIEIDKKLIIGFDRKSIEDSLKK